MDIPEEVTQETILEMANHGVLFSHKRSKRHPKMRPYVGGVKNDLEVLDPEAIARALKAAVGAMREVVAKGGIILAVGTTSPAREAMRRFADAFGFPYVTSRWLGGTLTNFKVISERLRYYADLKAKQARGEFAKHTKKEQLQLTKEIGRLAQTLDGLERLTRLPDMLFVADAGVHTTALREAARKSIPVTAICDTDDDPTRITHPIFASDHAKTSIDWVVERLMEGLEGARPVALPDAGSAPPSS